MEMSDCVGEDVTMGESELMLIAAGPKKGVPMAIRAGLLAVIKVDQCPVRNAQLCGDNPCALQSPLGIRRLPGSHWLVR